MVWGGTTMTRRIELHICQGNVTEHKYKDNVIESIVPYACRHGNAVIFQDDNARAHRERVVQDHQQFSRITTLPWRAKSSPQICLQLNVSGTSSGNVSGDGLTSHRTSTSSLTLSRSKQLSGGSSGTRAIVVSRGCPRMEVLVAIETSVKSTYRPIPNSKLSSS